MTNTAPPLNEKWLILLLASLMSLAALSIDAIMPALPHIANSFAVDAGLVHWVISSLLVGMTLGQVIYGPLSDSRGRRPALFTGMAIFLIGSLVCVFATDFSTLLGGRFLQGLGVASLRIVPTAIVRDSYEGAAMARISSMIVAVFIMVPCVAPLLGQSILLVAEWRMILWLLIALSLLLSVWASLHLSESLAPENRVAAGLKPILQGVRTTCSHTTTVVYTIALGLVQGIHTGYLISAEPIFHRVYATGDLFALYFAMAAAAIGVASYINARIVEKLGMQKICQWSQACIIVTCAIALAVETSDALPLAGFVTAIAIVFFCLGLLMGNMSAIAIQPLGQIAGTASSIINFIGGLIGLTCGMMIGESYNGTVLPLLAGILTTTLLSLSLTTSLNRINRPAYSLKKKT